MLLSLLILLRSTRATVAARSSRLGVVAQLRSVLHVRWARVVLVAVLAEGVFLLGPLAYLPAYLNQRHGLSLSLASALIALYAVGGLAYAITVRRLVRRLGERRMVLAGGAMMDADPCDPDGAVGAGHFGGVVRFLPIRRTGHRGHLTGYAFDHLGHGSLSLAPALALPLAGWEFARALRSRGGE